jgi:hypothetical protein
VDSWWNLELRFRSAESRGKVEQNYGETLKRFFGEVRNSREIVKKRGVVKKIFGLFLA